MAVDPSNATHLVTHVTSFTANDLTDDILICVNTGGMTVTLPAAATCAAGRTFKIKNTGASGTVTVAPTGSDDIEGTNSNYTTLSTQNSHASFASDGVSNWWVV